MPALEKIRNRSGLLIAVVGIALLSFILGDFFSSRNSYRGQPDIATINGKKIYYIDYQQRIEEAVDNMKRQLGQATLDDQTYNQLQDQIWEQLVNKQIIEDELEKLGLTVSSDELLDMVQGNNVHPEVRNIPLFQNPETGTFDPARVIQFLQNLDADNTGRSRQAWMSFEEYLMQQRQNEKYYALIDKALFVTDLQAKMAAKEKAEKVDLKVLYLPYTSINDSLVSVSDKDLSQYYQKHKKQHKQKLSVDLEYVVFPIEATESDLLAIVEELEDYKEEFGAVRDNKNYVNANSDGTFDEKYYRKNEYPNQEIDSLMFALTEGEIYGPYKEDNAFKITKLVSKEMRPDTIRIAQIALVPQKQDEVEILRNQADSIVELLNKGAKIETFASYSQNPEIVAPQWIKIDESPYGQAVAEHKKGEAFVELTNEGFLVIQVLERGKEELKVQLATIVRTISPSDNTRTSVYQKANSFAASIRTTDDFNKQAEASSIVKRVVPALLQTSREIRGLGNSRALITESFFATEGNLVTYRNNNSPIFEIGDNYVIALLKRRNEEGYKPLEDLKPTIEQTVRKQKKAQTIMANVKKVMSETSDIEQLSSKLEVEVKEVKGLTFASFSVPGLGIEPKINGVAIDLEKGKLSEPIEGNNGIYIINVTEKTESDPEQLNYDIEKLNMRRNIQARANSEISKILKDAAEIEDNRIMFQ